MKCQNRYLVSNLAFSECDQLSVSPIEGMGKILVTTCSILLQKEFSWLLYLIKKAVKSLSYKFNLMQLCCANLQDP